MSKENVMPRFEGDSEEAKAAAVIAQAVDRLTELLRPLVTEINAEIARQKAAQP